MFAYNNNNNERLERLQTGSDSSSLSKHKNRDVKKYAIQIINHVCLLNVMNWSDHNQKIKKTDHPSTLKKKGCLQCRWFYI